jgi:1-acyl-sn-glycerol-3-phosphate acyltransferase
MELPAGASVAEVTVSLHAELTALVEKVQASYPGPTTEAEQWWQPAHLGGGAPTLEEAKPIEAAAVEARAAKKAAKKNK